MKMLNFTNHWQPSASTIHLHFHFHFKLFIWKDSLMFQFFFSFFSYYFCAWHGLNHALNALHQIHSYMEAKKNYSCRSDIFERCWYRTSRSNFSPFFSFPLYYSANVFLSLAKPKRELKVKMNICNIFQH